MDNKEQHENMNLKEARAFIDEHIPPGTRLPAEAFVAMYLMLMKCRRIDR